MSFRNGPEVFDISPLISERIGVFPGDVRFQRSIHLDFKLGHHLLLSSIQTTLHLGAHADGPNHYAAHGAGIQARDLRLYMGDCLVVQARGFEPKERIGWKHLDPKWQKMKELPAARVLLRTGSFPNPDDWNSDFSSYDPELIFGLHDRGVKLIGIDTPSIDTEDSKELESHQAVASRDLAVLEGLCLEQVQEGLYTLIALPLKLENADAGPVRAVLLRGTGRLEA